MLSTLRYKHVLVEVHSVKANNVVIAVLALLSLAACGWAPRQEIKPKPNYIQAAVEPGDTVEIETRQGEKITFEVSDVTTDAIVGDTERVEFGDIARISKRSWKKPAHPCASAEPLGCSIPEVVLAMSELYKEQADKFHDACVEHDLCYRNGFATYGIDRQTCDAEFYENMKKDCNGTGRLGVLDPTNYGICQVAASQTYEAVRRFGESAYRTTTSSYCEYR